MAGDGDPTDPETFKQALQLLQVIREEAHELRGHNAALANELAASGISAKVSFALTGPDYTVRFACRLDDLKDDDVRGALVDARRHVRYRALELEHSLANKVTPEDR